MSKFRVSQNGQSERKRLQNRSSGQRVCACLTATVTSILVVVAVFGLTAYSLLRNRFGVNRVQVHSGDEVAVSRLAIDLSDKFCAGYEIEMRDRGNAYLLPFRAQTDTSYHEVEHFHISYVPEKSLPNTREFYLLENSFIKITGCHRGERANDVTAEMILYEREFNSHHPHHQRHEHRQNNEIKRVHIPRTATCDQPLSSLPKLEHTVTQEGDYYVILAENRGRHLKDGTVLNGTLMRTFYDVTLRKHSCEDRYSCYFDLDFDDDDDVDVVIRIPFNPSTPMAKSSFSTHCRPRMTFWMGIFWALPLILTAVLSAFFMWLFFVRMPSEGMGSGRCYCPRSSTTTSAAESPKAALLGKRDELVSNAHPTTSRGRANYKSVQEVERPEPSF